jgi:hypothetical protein
MGRPLMAVPILEDATRNAPRDAARDAGRDQIRQRPREPHEKYYVDPKRIPKGYAAQWIATKVRGAPARSMGNFFRAMWKPARAEDFPELSDFGLYDQSMVDMGVVPKINPDGPVVLDDQMLVLRPKKFSADADREREAHGRRQMEDHFRLVRERSERDIGPHRTRLSRTYGPQDIVQDEDG